MKHWLATSITIALFLQGCGETSFSGGDKATKGKNGNADGSLDNGEGGNGSGANGNGADGANGSGGNGDNNGGSGANGNGDQIFGGDGSKSVPKDCKNQSLLILDFKSGWWSGDGANTFSDVILDELKSKACTNGAAAVEYHHIIKSFAGGGGGSGKAKFYDKDFKSYTQVWILSGASGDSLDISVNEAGLLDVIAQIKVTKPKLFLGAGFGSIIHSNKVAKDVLGSELFKTAAASTGILSVAPDGKNVTVKTHTKPSVTGSLFTGVTGEIADRITVDNTDAASDEVIKISGLTVLSQCQMINGAKADCIGVGQVGGYNFIVDSGLQRFYSLHDSAEQNTSTYLKNIIRALSL